jgi:hypothetical protein
MKRNGVDSSDYSEFVEQNMPPDGRALARWDGRVVRIFEGKIPRFPQLAGDATDTDIAHAIGGVLRIQRIRCDVPTLSLALSSIYDVGFAWEEELLLTILRNCSCLVASRRE